MDGSTVAAQVDERTLRQFEALSGKTMVRDSKSAVGGTLSALQALLNN
jgi:hypothetical protein